MKVEQKASQKLNEAIKLELIRPPVRKRGKKELPKAFPGKPLSEYLKEYPPEKPYSHVILMERSSCRSPERSEGDRRIS